MEMKRWWEMKMNVGDRDEMQMEMMEIMRCMALFSKEAISKGMNPFVFVVYRQAFATLALAPFAFFLERLTPSLNLYYIAMNNTSASFAAATTNMIPAITFILAIFLRYER
ncbi:hypothetical protein RHGRI_016852 [Rhododendron griersonianum]|uniref:WAT1-related protein n=1 Tax=Rhododendron griersonianum TaxID=479676 RepID=A0AAV6JW26_9ERIC|nr:hypothetical protein RHGRI_016852 [Rhododendron griersonianum]